MRLSGVEDQDIAEWLALQPDKTSAIKQLIRDAIQETNESTLDVFVIRQVVRQEIDSAFDERQFAVTGDVTQEPIGSAEENAKLDNMFG